MPLVWLEATESGVSCCRCAMTRPPQSRICSAEWDVTSSCALSVPQAWAAVPIAVQEHCMLSCGACRESASRQDQAWHKHVWGHTLSIWLACHSEARSGDLRRLYTASPGSSGSTVSSCRKLRGLSCWPAVHTWCWGGRCTLKPCKLALIGRLTECLQHIRPVLCLHNQGGQRETQLHENSGHLLC